MGCSTGPGALSGNYTNDTLTVVQNLKTAIDLPADASNKKEILDLARKQINDYASRYRRDDRFSGLRSFTTMQTALNSLAGYYSSFGNRPLPDKLKKRLQQEFKQVELDIQRNT
jgi:photosystem II Psb27 protein